MSDLLELHLRTLFVFDAAGRICSTREPQATHGPCFILIRGPSGCVWAVRDDVDPVVSARLAHLAQEEPPLPDMTNAPPEHAAQYRALVSGQVGSGPAFTFPREIPQPEGVVEVVDERLIERHFHGWVPGEIRAGRLPVMAVMDQGYPVSVCFCARRSDAAAEAGVETAPGHQRRGYGARVTAAWALSVRSTGRVPLYSTDWSNERSLALARKLGLSRYAVAWHISG